MYRCSFRSGEALEPIRVTGSRRVRPVSFFVQLQKARMAYRFNGFFARPAVDRPAALPTGAVWRDVTTPFAGVGVHIQVTGFGNDELGPQEAQQLLAAIGLSGVPDWLYLSYVTWGGQIDYVYGLGVSGGRAFGPVRESDGQAREVYLSLMDAFGVSAADAFNFPPFVRGFWGE
jgi:hypothetical protein